MGKSVSKADRERELCCCCVCLEDEGDADCRWGEAAATGETERDVLKLKQEAEKISRRQRNGALRFKRRGRREAWSDGARRRCVHGDEGRRAEGQS